MTRSRLRIGLVALLSTVFAILVILTVGLSSVIGLWGVRRVTIDLLDEKGLASVTQLETALSHQLLPAQMAVEALGILIEKGQLDLSDHKTMTAVLSAGLASDPLLAALVVVTADYREIGARRDATGLVLAGDRDGGASPTQRARLDRARARVGTWWGEPLYAGLLGDAVVNVRHSIWRNGEFVGFVGAAITTANLRKLVDSLASSEDFRTTPFVLYGPDRVLAYSGYRPERAGSAEEPLPPLDSVPFQPVKKMKAAARVPGFPRSTSRGITVGRIATPEGFFLVLQKEVTGFGEEPWIIGLTLPDDELRPYFDTLRRTGYSAIVLTLLGALSALLIGRKIGEPIRRVVVSAGHVANIDLKHVGSIPPSRIAELDSLASAFNRMLGAIHVFERYIPKTLVERLIHSGTADRHITRERDLTVMFTDIAGFTHTAEGMSASAVASFLNAHFALLAGAVEAEGGTVDKYLGDGMMAFWGAPEKLKDRAARACRAALTIRAAIRADNELRRARGEDPIRLRIGIHRGPLIVGNIGAPGRINYTVVGDTVNVAQRLQDIGRQVDPSSDVIIIVSNAVAEQAGGRFIFDDVRLADLKGRTETVKMYRLTNHAEEHDAMLQTAT